VTARHTRHVTTVLVGDVPPVLEQWLGERRRLGLDRRDEVWEGALHVAPYAGSGHGRLESQLERLLYDRAVEVGLTPGGRFNLGEAGNYRVPDVGYHRDTSGAAWIPTEALIVEIRSPGDETDAKFSFYAAHRVQEILVVDPAQRSVRWWQLGDDGGYAEQPGSTLLDPDAATLAAELDWP